MLVLRLIHVSKGGHVCKHYSIRRNNNAKRELTGDIIKVKNYVIEEKVIPEQPEECWEQPCLIWEKG